ncbi:hypothetical protein COEREDRAFT_80802 [Coemansia reversa NRRL 1564]|uniref:Uncharacterized protein n=1 Tax=Coemansia reversa (strain ATCC 12441 / NRRL 1564) TaxID=763665 RepID=A0A2G5BDK2_COERN|nr:hypothetical protein COEREDRAFT_80802 [Coemansia reversa NRRL 1564]|eukprot:PIA17094.1 hypothetical protein COEREDRAFT_80802 [Coemansia reversa NRRL 1564]
MNFNGNYSHGYGGGSGYPGEESYQNQGQYPQYPQQQPQQQPQQGYEHYTHPQEHGVQFDQYSQASGYSQQQQQPPQQQREYSNYDGSSACGSEAYAYQNARPDEKSHYENGYYENGHNGANEEEDNERGLKEVFTKTTHDEYGTPRTQVNYLTTGIATVALVGGGIALRNYLKNKKAEKEEIPPGIGDTGAYPPSNSAAFQSGTAVNQDGSQYGYNPYKDQGPHYH